MSVRPSDFQTQNGSKLIIRLKTIASQGFYDLSSISYYETLMSGGRACIQIGTECFYSRTKTYHLETNMNPNAIKTLSFLCIVAIIH